jgi:ABC-type multidrug transport system, ATPase component
MINATNVTKKFGDLVALDNVGLTVETGSIFGLVGSNGAGKSTFMRLLSGVYKLDGGSISIDGKDIAGSPEVRKNLIYVPDELYFIPNSNMDSMARLCQSSRAKFDEKLYAELADKFEASRKKPIRTMSKGMKRQAALILAIASQPDILLIDETFDGLDVIKRHDMREILCGAVADRGLTVIMATHSMREVDDLCDSLAMLHKGKITLQSELDEAKTSLIKVQIAFPQSFEKDAVEFDGAKVLDFTRDGTVATVIYENDREQVERQLRDKSPLLMNVLPLSLEEVFIYKNR